MDVNDSEGQEFSSTLFYIEATEFNWLLFFLKDMLKIVSRLS